MVAQFSTGILAHFSISIYNQLKTSWKEVMGYGEENPANAWTIQ